MRNITKMWICMCCLIACGGLYQYYYGNQGTLIVGGICLFSISFGWYGATTKLFRRDIK